MPSVLDVLNALMPSKTATGDDGNPTPTKPKTLADFQRAFGANNVPVQQTFTPPPQVPDNSAFFAAQSADSTARLHAVLQSLGQYATRLRFRPPFPNSGGPDDSGGSAPL